MNSKGRQKPAFVHEKNIGGGRGRNRTSDLHIISVAL